MIVVGCCWHLFPREAQARSKEGEVTVTPIGRCLLAAKLHREHTLGADASAWDPGDRGALSGPGKST